MYSRGRGRHARLLAARGCHVIAADRDGLLRSASMAGAQVRATAFVAEPTGDADMAVRIKVVIQRALLVGKTMHHARTELSVEIAQHRDEVVVGVSLVQEQGFTGVDGDLQLHLEGASLRGAWREIAEVVETAFADRDDFRMLLQSTHFGIAFRRVLNRVMRMHTRRGEQEAGMLHGQLQGLG